MKAVVMDLLRQYLKVEIQFQSGECYSGLCFSSVLLLTLKGVYFNIISHFVHMRELIQH